MTDGCPAITRDGDQVRLKGFTHQGNWVSYMGALVSCATFLDPDASVAWLWGTCGYAFSLTVHEHLCPSGPYMPDGQFAHLLPNTGFNLELLSVEADADNAADTVRAMFDRARKAIDAGQSVMGWSLKHIDWYPIHGYDEKGHYLFLLHEGQVGKYPHAALGEKAPGGLALLILVTPGQAPNDAAVVRDALAFAAKMGRGECSQNLYTSGPAGYDVWIKALEQSESPDSNATSFGHAFNAACWFQCRRQAVAFLKEAKKRLADDSLSPHFDKAIDHYNTVFKQLKSLIKLYPCQPAKGAEMLERFKDTALVSQAVEILSKARAAEEEGLEAIENLAAAKGEHRQ